MLRKSDNLVKIMGKKFGLFFSVILLPGTVFFEVLIDVGQKVVFLFGHIACPLV